ncbi:hypothetical protein BOTBODRAFT_35469 [Botryobasidium botryosum FD-172 SS1]|uniref:Uncharacterized protein n=1 Tax=Botryobasidium botryosum (strain FD-172 SS1) TaxID=930990 RepID=A0A067M9N1_BOTB1|nr:hypothetical protein BOTBODRAFT_35469 [Botryobasidium botryosum FD-172 SS1]
MAADLDIQSAIEGDAVPTTRSDDIQESAPQETISDALKVNSPTAGRYITVTFVRHGQVPISPRALPSSRAPADPGAHPLLSPSPTPTPGGPETRTP